MKPFRVLILGGYGNFGRLIAMRLRKIGDIQLIIAGRNLAKAEAFATEIGAQALKLDWQEAGLAGVFAALNLDVVVSTAGPFQSQNYTVAEAAIEAGCHYIDLADAREFVCGIHVLNDQALAKNLLICAGASSVPGLSSAVVDELLPRFSQLEVIDFGISSSEKTPGETTLKSVLAYCGKPFTQWRNQNWQTVYGWQGLSSHRFNKIPEKRFLVSCNIPDLSLFPERYPDLKTVSFGAGVGLKTSQMGTWVLSWLSRFGIIQHPQKLSRFLHKGATLLEPLGNGLSGMFMKLKGRDHADKTLQLCWEIVAHDNDGPNIPCLAAVALVRKLQAGSLNARGAMSSIGLLSLNEYLAELQDLKIETDTYELSD